MIIISFSLSGNVFTMFTLFNKFTSGKTEIREKPNYYISPTIQNLPVWVQFRSSSERLRRLQNDERHKRKIKYVMENAPEGHTNILHRMTDEDVSEYTFAQWRPLTAKMLHPFRIDGQRSPDKKIGLADVFRETGRIKSFKLKHAILYSYFWDIRFVILLSIILGFSIWTYIAPDPLLNKPGALCSPDLPFLLRVIKNTYINHICSNHPDVSSPCYCGEPLNNTARIMFPETSFDPLKIDQSGKIKTISLMVATIIIAIALTESVSEYGVYININAK